MTDEKAETQKRAGRAGWGRVVAAADRWIVAPFDSALLRLVRVPYPFAKAAGVFLGLFILLALLPLDLRRTFFLAIVVPTLLLINVFGVFAVFRPFAYSGDKVARPSWIRAMLERAPEAERALIVARLQEWQASAGAAPIPLWLVIAIARHALEKRVSIPRAQAQARLAEQQARVLAGEGVVR